MSRSAFDKIAAGLDDAIAYAEGDDSRARVAAPVDVREVRAGLKMTQDQFAAAYRLPVGTVRDWEQKRRQPDAPARAYLTLIQRDPQAVRKILREA